MTEEKAKDAKKSRFIARRPDASLYNAKVHDKSIKEMFTEGLFAEDFCKKHDIGRATFYRWIKANPSFAEAANKGETYGEAKWLKLPLKYQDKSFSYQYWSSVMRNKYKYGNLKVENLGDKSPEEIINLALDKFGSGEISDNHVDKLINLAITKLKIYESTTMKDDLDAVKAHLGLTEAS